MLHGLYHQNQPATLTTTYSLATSSLPIKSLPFSGEMVAQPQPNHIAQSRQRQQQDGQ